MTETYTLITGASSGIGKELAEIFAHDGHNLILVARTEIKLLEIERVLEEKYNIRVECFPMDLAVADAAKRLHDQTAAYVVDNLVNSAGFGDWNVFLDADWRRQYEMVQLNVIALMQLIWLYGNDMRSRRYGRILNISSLAAFTAGPYMASYYATKDFVLNFSQGVAEELRGSGVTVTALCPGPTFTGFEAAAGMTDSRMFKLFRPADAKDVAILGYRAMQNGKTVACYGIYTKFLNVATRLSCRKLTRKIAAFINKKPSGRS